MSESERQLNGNIEIHPPGGTRRVLRSPEQCGGFVAGTSLSSSHGNLEIRNSAGTLLWESATHDMEANKMSLEKSGALAVYAVGRVAPVWTSKTSGNPGAFAAFQMDGNMVLYSAAREPL